MRCESCGLDLRLLFGVGDGEGAGGFSGGFDVDEDEVSFLLQIIEDGGEALGPFENDKVAGLEQFFEIEVLKFLWGGEAPGINVVESGEV